MATWRYDDILSPRRMATETLVGSIPERDPSDGKVYNTATVWSPEGMFDTIIC